MFLIANCGFGVILCLPRRCLPFLIYVRFILCCPHDKFDSMYALRLFLSHIYQYYVYSLIVVVVFRLV